jgi:hypothetical protein
MSDVSSAIKNWVPYRLSEENDEHFCRWLYTGDVAYTDPFFNDTIARCKKLDNNSRFLRSLSSTDILPHWAQLVESISPTAIIFHISRCGSTLISQLLGLQPANIVLSEVPFIDELLRKGFRENKMNETLPLVKAAIALYGARRTALQQQVFIKADSWHIHFYKELRSLYPSTPFIFLYREPDEVISSQQKKRGMQAVPGVIEPALFGFNIEEIVHLPLDEYMANVIETYLQTFIAILKEDKLTMAVNYNEGAINIVKKIASFTGISITEQEMQQMAERSGYHAKYPDQVFDENLTKKTMPAYLQNAFILYHEIEKMRVGI